MDVSEIVFHVIKRLFIVFYSEQTTEAGGDGIGFSGACQMACFREEAIDSGGAWFVNHFESLPFDAEADDSFVNGIIFVAIHLPLA